MKTIIVEDETQSDIKLTDSQKDEIVKLIITNWTVENTARNSGASTQLSDIKELRRLIYQSYPSQIEYGKAYTLPDLPEMQNILLSHLSEKIYHSNDALFEVRGLDMSSSKNAGKQKQALVADLDNMNFKKVIEDANEDFSVSGEYIFYVTYDVKKKKRKARKSDLQAIINGQVEDERITKLKQMFPMMTSMLVGEQQIEGYLVKNSGDIVTSENIIKMTKSHVYYEVTIYEGVKVEHIKSTDFNFDVQKVNRFESANKIWRTWLTPDEIFNNDIFDVDDDAKKLIESTKDVAQTVTSQNNIWYEYLPTMWDIVGNNVQVYNFYGDLRLKDGTPLKNYIISICRGKVIRCEANPTFIDPFVYYAPFYDPDTRRGISPLRIGVIFNAIRSNIANACTDLLALSMNPDGFCAKGQLQDRQLQRIPGKFYDYDTSESATPPMLNTHYAQGLNVGYQVMQFFEGSTESATGLTKNLGGSVSPDSKTATESTYIQNGSEVRMAYLTDKIKRNVNIALVEKIADIKSLHQTEDITIVVQNDKGEDEEMIIDSLVRNGRYKYTYLDDKSSAELEQRFAKLTQWAQLFLPTGIPNTKELWMEGLEQQSIKDPEKLTNTDPVDEVVNGVIDNAKMGDEQKTQAKAQLKQMAAGLLQNQLQQQQMNAQMQQGMANAPMQ